MRTIKIRKNDTNVISIYHPKLFTNLFGFFTHLTKASLYKLYQEYTAVSVVEMNLPQIVKNTPTAFHLRLVIVGVVALGSIGFRTGKVSGRLVNPDIAAVILALPDATPVARPVEEMVTIAGWELIQVTREETLAVDPSK